MSAIDTQPSIYIHQDVASEANAELAADLIRSGSIPIPELAKANDKLFVLSVGRDSAGHAFIDFELCPDEGEYKAI